jgi:hypothetical protein
MIMLCVNASSPLSSSLESVLSFNRLRRIQIRRVICSKPPKKKRNSQSGVRWCPVP